MDRVQLHRALRHCKPGESVVYHFGMLLRDRDRKTNPDGWQAVHEVANEAQNLWRDGVCDLVQKKLGFCQYAYLAVKRQ